MAVINPDTGIVENIVVVEDDIVDSDNLVTYTDENPAYIGGDFVDGFFYPPQPFPSWSRLEGDWIPPVPHPETGWAVWDEDAGAWLEVEDGPV